MLRIERATQPTVSWPLVFGIGGYLCLVALVHAFNVLGKPPHPLILCPFRGITGLPCPTCGTTRAGTALLTLHPLEALHDNPLTTVLYVVFGLWVVMRFVLRYRVVVDWTRRTRLAAASATVGLFLVNWVWVLHANGVF